MVEPLYPLRCLLAQASQHLWLVNFDDVYREFTCVHHTIHPAPSPPDAGRDTVPSRFGCQSGDCGYRVRRLCTGRDLPAHLRRILLMEQQVWSIQLARQSTLRPRVAATTKSGGMWASIYSSSGATDSVSSAARGRNDDVLRCVQSQCSSLGLCSVQVPNKVRNERLAWAFTLSRAPQSAQVEHG